MSISVEKNKTALGEVLLAKEKWQRIKIKSRLLNSGLTEGKWRGLQYRVEAHLLPAFVRDIIIEELPETQDLFKTPEFKSEKVA